MEEKWKDIKGYKNKYQVSNLGRVKNATRNNILKLYMNERGYMSVYLSNNGEGKHYKVHRLVASHFIPNPENKPTVNHKDCGKANNYVTNLEWATYSENIKHAYNNGLMKNNLTNEIRKKRKTFGRGNKKVVMYDVENGEILNTFISITEAANFVNGKVPNIIACCKGRYKTSYGYKWDYLEN